MGFSSRPLDERVHQYRMSLQGDADLVQVGRKTNLLFLLDNLYVCKVGIVLPAVKLLS